MKAALSLFSVFCIILITVASAQYQLIQTPFGLRPKQCVHEIAEENAFVTERDNQMYVQHVNGTIIRPLPVLPECIIWNENWLRSFAANKTDYSIKEDGWLDNAYYYTPRSTYAKSFTGTYTVPPSSPANGVYWLYYFIGLVNFQQSVEATILQPVLAWTGSKWTVTPWNCCPRGQSHYGKAIDVPQGASIGADIAQMNSGQWNVKATYKGKTSSLTVSPMGRVFNYADVTLEKFSADTCDRFPKGDAVFSNLKLTLNNGVINPIWQITPNTLCRGKVIVKSSSEVVIRHN